jgi:hypothetical protein
VNICSSRSASDWNRAIASLEPVVFHVFTSIRPRSMVALPRGLRLLWTPGWWYVSGGEYICRMPGASVRVCEVNGAGTACDASRHVGDLLVDGGAAGLA